jgi:hypothetical protein
MSEAIFYQYEPSARELVKTVLGRANASNKIPKAILPLVEELMVDAAHDAIEFGEAIAALPSNQPTPLEHFHRGYMDAIEDLQGGCEHGDNS